MIVLDSGAVSFLARTNDVTLALHRRLGGSYVVPSMVLVECLSGRASDAQTHRFLKTCRVIEAVPVDLAREAARLRHLAGRGSAVDALVVALAQGATVVTGDEKDISALAAHAREVRVVTL